MKLRKVLFVLMVAMLVFDIGLVLRHKHLPVKPPLASGAPQDFTLLDGQCMVIHRPAKGCPPGYKPYSEPTFTEKDGSKQFACWTDDPSKEPCIDTLRSGETYRMQELAVPHERKRKHDDLPPEPPAPKPAGERKL